MIQNWYPSKTNNHSYHIVMHNNKNENEDDGDDRLKKTTYTLANQ
jgi:hypothetical protein